MKKLFKQFKQKGLNFSTWYKFFNDVLSKNTYLKYLQCIDIFLNQATKQTLQKNNEML
ncbi:HYPOTHETICAL PROTEIN MCJ_002000 [Mesomycoplasma conjunctivae]|uniref:Uncharacterized protein n=1 Tax=Mesomycoplasma conjunctivae (strain ATCC 25834 / NCTC 10147 / HRC/581) TaxID=572263 RepID=C5J5Z9_MESCH|nr:hypothetical protein [Mesomycoplasma conjunctivae]CAT04891.1 HYPOTHETICAL PROTEIN MCJ_002000 [Mesomycoplasma conjunctivae]